MKKVCSIFILLLVITAAGYSSQEENILTINVLELLGGSINGTYEFTSNKSSSLGLSGSFMSMSMSDWDISSWGIGGFYNFYPAEEALSGFFFGPSIGVMGVSAEYLNEEDTGTFFNLGGHLGYRWIWDGGVSLGLAIGAGYTAGEIEIAGDTIPISGVGLTRASVDFGYAW